MLRKYFKQKISQAASEKGGCWVKIWEADLCRSSFRVISFYQFGKDKAERQAVV